MTRFKYSFLAAAALAAGLATIPAGAAPNDVVARLGKATLSQQDLTQWLSTLPEAERAAVRGDRAVVEQWLRQRIAGEALLGEARAKGWDKRPEIKSRIDEAVRDVTERITAASYLESVSEVPAGYPSEAEIAAAYEQGKADFQVPALYRVAQIYLTAPRADATAVNKAREQARKLVAQARKGDFAALAREHSQEPRSAANGGEVGTLPLAQLLPEVRDAVSRLKAGEVAEPVQSDSGLHIVKLVETTPQRTATLDEMRPRLREALRQQRQQQLVQEHMAKLTQAGGGIAIEAGALDAALR